jgi:prevent-host-death family protein
MRIFSSAHAKNHFGELIDAARVAPVAVTKYDRPFVVVMAVEEFERLSAGNPCSGTRDKTTISPRRS